MRLIQRSIFFRIYVGLIILVMVVAVASYFAIKAINYHRIQKYRESMANGVAHVITEVMSRQPTKQAQQEWLEDVSSVLELQLNIVDETQMNISHRESLILSEGHAVVQYDEEKVIADVYIKLKDSSNNYLHILVDKLSEVQLKMLPILVLEDLVYFPGNEEERLRELQYYFPYQIGFKNLSELNLDIEQLTRLRMDKTHTILVHSDTTSNKGATISVVSAYSSLPNKVLVLGPARLFTWMPVWLVTGITLFSLLSLSFGTYFLLRPLQSRLATVRQALNCVRQGDLSTRLEVEGADEISSVSLSFNMMITHIERLIEAQRELTRAVSHELRTPVARVRFGMEMLTDTDDYDSRVQQMEMIDKDIEALNSLIDEIITYAKLEQGTPSLNFEHIVLKEILKQVMHETNVLNKDKELSADLPDDTVIVEAEHRYLHRVIQNFVGNALRYSKGRVHVTGGVDAEGMAFVCVEDDGDGIPEKDRSRVFEAFTRLDDSRTRASGGYGLGLSIVSRIAYWFGGFAKVDESPKLGGARFVMYWPQYRSSSATRKLREKIRN